MTYIVNNSWINSTSGVPGPLIPEPGSDPRWPRSDPPQTPRFGGIWGPPSARTPQTGGSSGGPQNPQNWGVWGGSGKGAVWAPPRHLPGGSGSRRPYIDHFLIRGCVLIPPRIGGFLSVFLVNFEGSQGKNYNFSGGSARAEIWRLFSPPEFPPKSGPENGSGEPFFPLISPFLAPAPQKPEISGIFSKIGDFPEKWVKTPILAKFHPEMT